MGKGKVHTVIHCAERRTQPGIKNDLELLL